jgi:hypothetical protein
VQGVEAFAYRALVMLAQNPEQAASIVSRSLVHATRQTPECEEAHFVPGSCDSILTGAVSDRAPGTSWDPVQP